MHVRFYTADGTLDVGVGFHNARVPVAGEEIEPVGDDDEFPPLPDDQVYMVKRVAWEVGLHGPRRAHVELETPGQRYQRLLHEAR